MVKKMAKKRANVSKKVATRVARPKRQPNAAFGALSTVQTAPVAIGNSVRGMGAQTTRTQNGLIVKGRDFMFTPVGSGSVQTWTCVGGSPLSPAVFSDSNVRQYMQMYQKYRWRYCAVHYITSSPTSANGDVMFYYAKNRDSVFLNQTSTQLLPFVMSDASSVIGPQWTNHSTVLEMRGTWKSTDYGMTDAVNDYSDGDVFLLSKTTTTDSPGYVIFDYVIEFDQMQISPRLLTLPLPRAQWSNMSVGGSSLTHAAGDNIAWVVYGNNISGSASVIPTGCSNGDIYKVFIDFANSATVPAGVSTFRVPEGGGYVTTTMTDGTTIYVVYNGTSFVPYPNSTSVYANGSDVLAISATVTSITYTLQLWLSLIGTVSSKNLNPNF